MVEDNTLPRKLEGATYVDTHDVEYVNELNGRRVRFPLHRYVEDATGRTMFSCNPAFRAIAQCVSLDIGDVEQ